MVDGSTFVGHIRRVCEKCGAGYYPKIERCACLSLEEKKQLKEIAEEVMNRLDEKVIKELAKWK